MDDGDTATEMLDNVPRIFRQPIQGIFNPKVLSHVGFSKKQFLPTDFCFRLLEDNIAPDEIDKIYSSYNIVESENSWIYVLDKIVKSGSKELSCKSTMQYKVTINSKGKVQWSNLLPLSIEKVTKEKEVPMPFGSILDYDKLNFIFINHMNELDLIDKAYKYSLVQLQLN